MTEQNKVAELMKPRVKIIADWPLNGWPVGSIFTANFYDKWKDFPHLFKELQWWQDRKPEEMPEYFKIPIRQIDEYEIGNDSVHSVKEEGCWSWHERDAYIFSYKKGGGTLSNYLHPATKSEYDQYIKQKL